MVYVPAALVVRAFFSLNFSRDLLSLGRGLRKIFAGEGRTPGLQNARLEDIESQGQGGEGVMT